MTRGAAQGAAALALLAALAGCAGVPRPAAPAAPPAVAPVVALAGRLSVQVAATPAAEARSVTAAFDLAGGPEQGRLDLATPLGTVLAQARWSPERVALVTPQGERRFASLEDLAQEVLGERVPVAALFDWLRGRPWSGAPSTPNPQGGEPGFRQLGWTVNLARFDEGLVAAQRATAPAVTVRAKLDRP